MLQPPPSSASDDAIRFVSITKRFGATLANDAVSFAVRRGSVHALLGENGAGKTTLMRILGGEVRSDSGSIEINGRPARLDSPVDAKTLGIRFVHQHPSLIPNLTIAENFVLGEKRSGLLLSGALSRELHERASEFGIEIDAGRYVWELSPGQRQWLEVFRATFYQASIIVLDEPTSLLSAIEGDVLLEKMRGMTRAGPTVILITHKIREVFKYADYVTVLRSGRHERTAPVQGFTESSLTQFMLRTELPNGAVATQAGSRTAQSETVLEARGLMFRDSRGRELLRSVSLKLERTVVLGVIGVAGNGQSEMARILAGLESPHGGSVQWAPGTRQRVRYIPDERLNLGAAPALTVAENLTLRSYRDAMFSRHGFIDWRQLRGKASALASEFHIRTASLDAPLRSLSGGNIQRVIVSRELADSADVLIAHNPTAGLDVATAMFVRNQIGECARNGVAVLLISDDLDELLAAADRILVLQGATIAGDFKRHEFDTTAIGAAMLGFARQHLPMDKELQQ